ncbi:hypothetical protein US8_04131 [Bacillus altitudinis]|nr:hypothetical protein US8_04131 [Bacillus altitudinis]
MLWCVKDEGIMGSFITPLLRIQTIHKKKPRGRLFLFAIEA